MKRATLIAMVCCLILCGCAESQPVDEPATESQAETEKKYTVRFDSQGGSPVASQEVARGDKAKKPADPMNDRWYYKFDGWYYGDEEWSFIGYVVTEDITLKAKWVEDYGLSEKQLEYVKYYLWEEFDLKLEQLDIIEFTDDSADYISCYVCCHGANKQCWFIVSKNESDLAIPDGWREP